MFSFGSPVPSALRLIQYTKREICIISESRLQKNPVYHCTLYATLDSINYKKKVKAKVRKRVRERDILHSHCLMPRHPSPNVSQR
jgi:hypothetical protein